MSFEEINNGDTGLQVRTKINRNFDIHIKDKEREAFEAATGGQCTIERTALGQPCYMFVMPKTTWEELVPSGELGTGVHEAFIEGGVEKSRRLIGMYPGAVRNGELVSQPGLAPRRSVSWDAARAECQAAGFDMCSNWEWSLIAFWCMANGHQPRGNTSTGASHSHPYEQGVNVEYGNTATGSGPDSWRHNNAAHGIADLVGNVWEWQWGLKMTDGRILVAPDNDKSLDESAWVDTGYDLPGSAASWSSLTQAGATQQVQRALIVPNGVADPDGRLYATLSGERFPLRGGNRNGAGHAGPGALYLYSTRTASYPTLGVRPTG